VIRSAQANPLGGLTFFILNHFNLQSLGFLITVKTWSCGRIGLALGSKQNPFDPNFGSFWLEPFLSKFRHSSWLRTLFAQSF